VGIEGHDELEDPLELTALDEFTELAELLVREQVLRMSCVHTPALL
jgi:hypothetical protein